MPRLGGYLWNFVTPYGTKKLEWWTCWMAKTITITMHTTALMQYQHWTDGRTDRRREMVNEDRASTCQRVTKTAFWIWNVLLDQKRDSEFGTGYILYVVAIDCCTAFLQQRVPISESRFCFRRNTGQCSKTCQCNATACRWSLAGPFSLTQLKPNQSW